MSKQSIKQKGFNGLGEGGDSVRLSMSIVTKKELPTQVMAAALRAMEREGLCI